MPDSSTNNPSPFTVREKLKKWFDRPLGNLILDKEQVVLESILPDLFGYHCMQIGLLHGKALLGKSRISHGFVAQMEDEGSVIPPAVLQCAADNLCIASDSVDVVVLTHVLEFSSNPHKILREIQRILIGEGHLVIVGFNPWSLFGVWRILLAWREEPPWCGHFFSLHRIRDWFTLLEFEVVKTDRFFFRPPIQSQKIMRRLEFLEKLGKYCWSFFGGIYVVVVKKHVAPLTPIKDIWSKRRNMIKAGLVEPTTRITTE